MNHNKPDARLRQMNESLEQVELYFELASLMDIKDRINTINKCGNYSHHSPFKYLISDRYKYYQNYLTKTKSIQLNEQHEKVEIYTELAN